MDGLMGDGLGVVAAAVLTAGAAGLLVAVDIGGDLAREENAGDGMLDNRDDVLIGTAGPSVSLNGDVIGPAGLGRLIW